MLTCLLVKDPTRAAASAAVVVLRNDGPDPVDIRVTQHPLQHLDLRVERDGVPLSTFKYGSIFSDTGVVETLTIPPGETYSHTLNLLRTVRPAALTPGRYAVTAEYTYGGGCARSNPMVVDVG